MFHGKARSWMSWQKLGDVGSQTPRVRKVPPYVSTGGIEAIELYESTGQVLDPWQKIVLEDGCGELPNGRWAAFEVATIVPRQNGKGTIIEAREIAGLYLFGSRLLIHSAHEFKTAAEGFRRVKSVIDNTDDLRRKVKKVTEAHGEEGIELLNGARLRFMARTRGSGRGFSADDLFLDEAYELQSASVAAMLPTLSARPNPQIWYFSSAPLRDSDQLRKIMKRGRSDEPARRLAYFEWSAPRDASLDDPDALSQANPGLGIRLSREFCQTERDAMDDVEYARERLGIEEDTSGSTVIDMRVWAQLQNKAKITGKIVLAFDMDNERAHTSISVAGGLAGGLVQAELIDNRTGHPYWLVDRIVELNRRHRPLAILVNGNSPANTEVSKLEDKGIKIYKVSASEMVTACGQFYDHCRSEPDHRPTGRFAPHPALNASIIGARKRALGDGWAWARRDVTVDISPVVSITLAMWGYVTMANKRKGSPPRAAWV
jgi:hypothetical protein